MNALAETLKTQFPAQNGISLPFIRRALALAALVAATVAVPSGVEIVSLAIVDAYLQVTVFVAATILVLYATEGLFRADLGQALARHRR